MDKKITITLITVTIVLSLTWFSFSTSSNEISSTILLDTSKTVMGQDILYPIGPAHITSKLITIPPGAQTGFHTHEYPLFAYVMEGTVTIMYGDESSDAEFITKEFFKGDSFVEAIDYYHNGKNIGDTPAKILIVIMDINPDLP